jgi:hypothetical protein
MALVDDRSRYLYLVRSELADAASAEGWHDWYDNVHLPKLLSVPGFNSATRFQERGTPNRFLAAYGIESPAVFDEPRYKEITGWGDWANHLKEWRRAICEVVTDLPGGPTA